MRRAILVGVVAVLAVGFWYTAYRATVFTVSIAPELNHAVTLATLRPRAQSTVVYDRYGDPAFWFLPSSAPTSRWTGFPAT